MQRLLEVLVVGGAALVGCTSSEGDGAEGGADGAGGAGTTSTSGSAGGADGAGGAGTTSTSGSAGGAGEVATTTSAGGLDCSSLPTFGDACGCPCCWVEDCGNDAECCPEAFRCTP